MGLCGLAVFLIVLLAVLLMYIIHTNHTPTRRGRRRLSGIRSPVPNTAAAAAAAATTEESATAHDDTGMLGIQHTGPKHTASYEVITAHEMEGSVHTESIMDFVTIAGDENPETGWQTDTNWDVIGNIRKGNPDAHNVAGGGGPTDGATSAAAGDADDADATALQGFALSGTGDVV